MSVAIIVLAAIAVVLVVRVAYHQLHLTALRGWLRRPQLETLTRSFDADRLLNAFANVDRALVALDRNASPKIVADWVALNL